MSRSSVDGLGHIFEDQVEEYFILLLGRSDTASIFAARQRISMALIAHLVTVRVEKGLEVDNVGVRDEPHDL